MSETKAPAATPTPTGTGVAAALAELTKLCTRIDRADLAERATAAGARLNRPSTIVCVVGEFKQGKSSLVNGLLGTDVCPVDDDLATSAITLVKYGEKVGAVVRRRVDGKAIAERCAIEDLTNWASEIGNPGNAKGVERVEISVPSAILKQGLVLVDTPGMGGLGAGHAAATLSFLPFADGVILVSDASAELSAPELAFLRRASELCPTVMFALTKIDLFGSWERILDRNKGHLAREGIEVAMVSVSSAVRHEALARKDRALNASSNFPTLISSIASDVIDPAKASATQRSANDAHAISALLRSGFAEEQTSLADPAALDALVASLDASKQRLEHLRGPAARWSQVVGDRVNDLSSSVNFQFRAAMRNVTKAIDERVETLTKGEEWDELGTALQRDVADQVATAFATIESARATIRAEIIELLADDELAMRPSTEAGPNGYDVADLWRGKGLNEGGAMAKKGFQTGLTGLRGAQSGVMMFGMVGGFLPAAATAFMATNPVLLGAGALFGGMQLMEDRKRKVGARRQSARAQVRQFLDDVQFDVGNELTNMIRELQRDLRDEFTDRLAELQRTYADAAKRAQDNAQRTQAERQARGTEIEKTLALLTKIDQVASDSASEAATSAAS